MTTEGVLLVSNLSEGVKTGLYDYFNKSFTVNGNGDKYLRMRVSSGPGGNTKPFKYNARFNCLYLLLSRDLPDV